MALVCREPKLLYILVPATGCSVVSEVLRNHYCAEELGRKHNDVPELVRLGLISAQELEEYVVVANIRNPFDRIHTYYARLTGPWLEHYFGFRLRDLDRKSSYLSAKELENLKANIIRERRRKLSRQKILKSMGFNFWFFTYLLKLSIVTFSIREEERSRRLSAHIFPMLSGVNVVIRREQIVDAFSNLQRKYLGNEKPIQLTLKNKATIVSKKKNYITCYNWFNKSISCKMFEAYLKQYGYNFSALSSLAPTLTELDKSSKKRKLTHQ